MQIHLFCFWKIVQVVKNALTCYAYIIFVLSLHKAYGMLEFPEIV